MEFFNVNSLVSGLEVGISVEKMGEFCSAAYLISRHSEHVLRTLVSLITANIILNCASKYCSANLFLLYLPFLLPRVLRHISQTSHWRYTGVLFSAGLWITGDTAPLHCFLTMPRLHYFDAHLQRVPYTRNTFLEVIPAPFQEAFSPCFYPPQTFLHTQK